MSFRIEKKVTVGSFIKYAIPLETPKNIRIQRVKERSFQKFGNRILPGGDLYERESEFFDMVESRAEDIVEEWVKTLDCAIMRVDGTKLVEENINLIIESISHKYQMIEEK